MPEDDFEYATYAQWYGVLRNELAYALDEVGCLHLGTPRVRGFRRGDATSRECTVPPGTVVMFSLGYNVFYPCPEGWPQDEEEECAEYADELVLLHKAKAGPLFKDVKFFVDGVQETRSLHLEATLYEMDHKEGKVSEFFFAKDSEGPGSPVKDVDCAAPWEQGNVCGKPPGPKKFASGGFSASVRFNTPGTHVITSTQEDVEWTKAIITVEAP